jgi:hypothetical protein
MECFWIVETKDVVFVIVWFFDSQHFCSEVHAPKLHTRKNTTNTIHKHLRKERRKERGKIKQRDFESESKIA